MLSVACHPSGKVFATGSSDARVKLWDLQTRTCAQTVTEHSDQVIVLDQLLLSNTERDVQVMCCSKFGSTSLAAGA